MNNLVGVISVQPYDMEIEDFRGRSDRIYTTQNLLGTMLSLFSASPSLNVGIAPASAARATTSMAQARAVKATPLPASVKPGVVTGQALQDLLDHAKENQYAIPAVNVVSSCSIAACLEAAKEYGGPMIIQFSRGGGQFICGKAADNTDDAACIAGTVAVRATRFPNSGRASRFHYHAGGRSPGPITLARFPYPTLGIGSRISSLTPSLPLPPRRVRCTPARSPSSTACP